MSKIARTSNYLHDLTLHDNTIQYGCELKTIAEWREWLTSDAVIATKRDDPKFKLIELSLQLAIAQHDIDLPNETV